jgi:hypothetical protein
MCLYSSIVFGSLPIPKPYLYIYLIIITFPLASPDATNYPSGLSVKPIEYPAFICP